MEYEETPDGNKKRKMFKKKELSMDSKVKTKKPTTKSVKTTLSIYTYLNFKRFGLAIAIDEGIKVTVLWFETHIKFEKR
jgi:hypothetical protein